MLPYACSFIVDGSLSYKQQQKATKAAKQIPSGI
jgi:hypothetical protein